MLDDQDLELLNDPHQHLVCNICWPKEWTLGTPIIAYCGRHTITFTELQAIDPPSNACPDCLTMTDQPCPECGS